MKTTTLLLLSLLLVGCDKQIDGTVNAKKVNEGRFTHYQIQVVETNWYQVSQFEFERFHIGGPIAIDNRK